MAAPANTAPTWALSKRRAPADNGTAVRRPPRASVAGSPTANAASRFQIVQHRTVAIVALWQLRRKMTVAVRVVEAILGERGTAISLDELIRAALPRCSD